MNDKLLKKIILETILNEIGFNDPSDREKMKKKNTIDLLDSLANTLNDQVSTGTFTKKDNKVVGKRNKGVSYLMHDVALYPIIRDGKFMILISGRYADPSIACETVDEVVEAVQKAFNK